MDEPFDLARFVAAQDPVLSRVLAELRRGRKQSHWMWYMFPQLAGLGSSPMAVRYAISGQAEAAAFLAHPQLGERLRDSIAALLAAPGDDPVAILGPIDATKLRSSMTLFEAAAKGDEDASGPIRVLERFYAGSRDERTLALLDR